MHRPVRFAAVLIVLAFAIPSAQADRRKQRQSPRISVTKWWPQSGPVGTTVHIAGSGFTRQTQLLIGGNIIRPRRLSARRITFVIPDDYGDGSLLLRRAGNGGGYDEDDDSGQQYEVGTYNVMVPEVPEITRWSPKFGGPGTRVRIEGRHFEDADVFWGNKRLKIESSGQGWYEVFVPARARRSEFFSVRSAYGKAVTPSEFELYSAVTLDRLDNYRATYGQTIILHGSNFNSSTEVFWGDTPLSVSKFDRRGRRLWITIPDDLSADTRWIHVSDGRSRVRSPKQFEIYADDEGSDDDDY